MARSNEGALQGVPLVRREQLPAHQRRDIDGAYGELPTEQFSPRRLAPRPQQPSVNAQALRYEDFLVVSDGSQDPVQVRHVASMINHVHMFTYDALGLMFFHGAGIRKAARWLGTSLNNSFSS